MPLLDADDLGAILEVAGETFVMGDSREFQGAWNFASSDVEMVRGGQATVLALYADAECISNGDSIYREADEPPVEYEVKDKVPDGLEGFTMLILERQDAD